MDSHVQLALVIDDDQGAHALYHEILGALGCKVEVCAEGAKGADALARRSYDLIVLNPQAPGVGIDILVLAHRQPSPPALLVLAAIPDVEETAPEWANGMLYKPFAGVALRNAASAAIDDRLARAKTAHAGGPPRRADIVVLYQQIAHLLLARSGADRISLMLWSNGSDRVTVAAAAGAPFAIPGDTSAPLNDSISGWVVRHAEPLLIEPDGDLPFDLLGIWRGGSLQSGMCVPLVARGQVIGVLAAARRRSRMPFVAQDLERLLVVAVQVASVLDMAQQQWQSQRRAHYLARLGNLGAVLVATLDESQVLRQTVEHLRAGLPHTRGYIFLREHQSPWFDSMIPLGEPLLAPPTPDELRDEPGMAGLTLSDGAPRLRYDVVGAPDLPAWERALVDPMAPSLLCVSLKTANGVYGAIELAGEGEPLDDDELQFVVAVATLAAASIEKARYHTQVAQSEARYHALFEHAGAAMFVIDPLAAAIVGANPAAERMSGYSQAELQMIAPARLIAPGGPGRPAGPVSELFSGAVPEGEGVLRTRSGFSVPVSLSVAEIDHDGPRRLLLIARNIAEQQRQSQRQAQAEKLAGMARLTAAIAHEINNPLQALHNTLHLLLNRSFTEEKRDRLLNMAQMEVDRLTTLVRRMLELHRPASEDMRPVSVHGLLEGALAGAASQLQQHRVLIQREWAEQLPWVLGIGGHLKQVFQDLATNAVDAMPDGGQLVIRTRLEEVAGATPRVLVEFADSGPGLSDGEAHLIFEPFYSTKRGATGLGLSISYSIVERHGGSISVSSSSDGTTFQVALPAAILPALV
jgi:two-component system NtrC family sensor kinase